MYADTRKSAYAQPDKIGTVCLLYEAFPVAKIMGPIRRVLYLNNGKFSLGRAVVTTLLLVATHLSAPDGTMHQYAIVSVVNGKFHRWFGDIDTICRLTLRHE